MNKLVFFDLDGTISRHDTLLPYIFSYALRRPWRLPRFILVLPAVLQYALGVYDHGLLKQALLRRVLGGASRASLRAHTVRWITSCVQHGCFRDALEAIAAHKAAGDTLILMSASVDLYVPALAAALGFSDSICTSTQWHGDQYDGKLTSTNIRDQEKARQVGARMQGAAQSSVAYGNSAPDLPHLRLVDKGYLINGNRKLTAAAEDAGIHCLRWR